jgi:hypothetical protein
MMGMMMVATGIFRACQATPFLLARLQETQNERSYERADEDDLHRAQLDAEPFVHATALPRRALGDIFALYYTASRRKWAGD